jgi:hypothetical protein
VETNALACLTSREIVSFEGLNQQKIALYEQYLTRELAMSITLDLPQELERELSMEATRLGLSLSEYALRLLSSGAL